MKIKAKIIGCSSEHYWYKDKIGEIIEVKELSSHSAYYEVTKVGGKDFFGYTIFEKDIEFIS